MDYPIITKFTLPAVAGISAYEIAAALGCINARTHLQTLEVPGETVYNNIEAVDADNNLDAGFMTPLIGSSVLVNLDVRTSMARTLRSLDLLTCWKDWSVALIQQKERIRSKSHSPMIGYATILTVETMVHSVLCFH